MQYRFFYGGNRNDHTGNQEFKENILETVIFDYSLKDPIVIKEIGDSDTLGKVNFRLVTENNDLLVVVGIDQEYANKLSDIVSTISNKENNLVYVKNDEHGISNTLIIILTIILIAILLAGVIFFMMANR